MTLAHLTPREREVLALIGQGFANKEIGRALSIHVHTVERHVANMYVKLGIRGRAEAAVLADRSGLVDSGDTWPKVNITAS